MGHPFFALTITSAICLLPSALLAADNNAKLIDDAKSKLAAFREAEKKQPIEAKKAEIAAATAGEIDANLPITFTVSPAGKWKFQQPGHQVSELKRLNAELQKLDDGKPSIAAPALNFQTMKKGDFGRIELMRAEAFQLRDLKTTPVGKGSIVLRGNLDLWVKKQWQFTNSQRNFSIQGINDPTAIDYTKDVFIFVGTAKVKGISMPRLICIEQSAPAGP